MKPVLSGFFKRAETILYDAFSFFRKNNDLSSASSLAFSSTLALIPSLFLLTFLLGALIGSSGRALENTQTLIAEAIPAYSQVILREVRLLSTHKRAISILNLLVLFWCVTPFVADMRISLGTIFRKKPSRPYLLEKLLDLAIAVIFLIGLSAIAVTGVFFSLAEKRSHLSLTLGYVASVSPFFFVCAIVFTLYLVFSKRVPAVHLAIGALFTALLWFAMRPVFNLFLIYNPGYGFAFGSFKSLFVVIIWIYCSLVVFLLGAEISASLGRERSAFIRGIAAGAKGARPADYGKYSVDCEKGSLIFREGEQSAGLFFVLAGSVSVRKDGREVERVPPGGCFGVGSFLLSSRREATAVALEDVNAVAVNNDNIYALMDEHPEIVMEVLRWLARRLHAEKEANF
jgi:membrane protein